MPIRITASEAKRLGIEAPKKKATQELVGGMNKTESRFADLLWLMKHDGEIIDYAFEPEKFRLAQKTFLLPDFRVTLPNFQNVFVEVKAAKKNGAPLWTDDGAVKIKTIPELHPYAFFLAVYGHQGWSVTRMPSQRWGHIKADIEWPV
jgi:hypothetical protein